ncbi:MAG: SurA N-terminal domain-containing protein [Candidatus Pacebacteria bacterium]|nr:SurA N-terminal domain-containing protein [Candidatus Paceibacterota bacterium]MBP9842434.1 SurA N-terminal domain-containing protein [Candidatus Paceibacterota bacterium]
MNEQEKNTEDTSTPNPESQVETTTTDVSESMTETTGEIVTTPIEEVKEAVSETVSEVEEASLEVITPVEEAKEVIETETEVVAKASPVVMVMAYVVKAKDWILGRKYTISAVVLVIVALVGLLYIMEEQGRINTGVFDKAGSLFASHKAIAKVNDGKVTQKQLETSISQISAGAAAQGMDTTDPELATQIQSQAVEMLINTELLMQEAEVRDIEVTSADVDERINTLTEEVGGKEVLLERMKQFGIDDKTLRSDVRNELTIQALLDVVFAEKKTDITDEEVKAFYDAAGGEGAGLPALEEVAEQIKEQIKSTKEQEQVTALIEELRGKATIEILI